MCSVGIELLSTCPLIGRDVPTTSVGEDLTAASRSVRWWDCPVTASGNRNPALPTGVGESTPRNTEDIFTMPKLKNLAALAAAVEAGRRYARKNPDKAGKYVDQAAAFVDKQTKGKYSGQIDGVIGKVKGAAGLPRSPRPAQGFETNAGYGQHEGYGRTAPVAPPVTPTTSTTPTTAPPSPTPPVTTPPTAATVDPEGTGERHFPGSKDV
jgi:MT0933-like antitoxin protein